MTSKDKLLFALFHAYRQQKNRAVALMDFCQQNGEDYEEVQRCAVELTSENSVEHEATPNDYRLTAAGYAKYADHMRALDFIHPDTA